MNGPDPNHIHSFAFCLDQIKFPRIHTYNLLEKVTKLPAKQRRQLCFLLARLLCPPI